MSFQRLCCISFGIWSLFILVIFQKSLVQQVDIDAAVVAFVFKEVFLVAHTLIQRMSYFLIPNNAS